MNSRRSFLRGAAGAGAAATMARTGGGVPELPPQAPYALDAAASLFGRQEGSLLSAAAQAAYQLAEQRRDAEQRRIDREIASLQRMRSVSAAYVAWRSDQLYTDRQKTWDTFEKAVAKLMG